MNLTYYRTHSHPEIWDNFFDSFIGNTFVPKGYKLVEDEEYKKKELEKELKGLESRIETLQDYVVKTEEKRKTVEEELKKLK